MDEIWERAVEAALEGQTDPAGVRALTLDGAVKCLHGRLPPPSVLEKFQNLQHLSIANVGVSSLEQFPRLRNLQKLILSDNRIAGGLEFLVEAGLDSLRDLDLSNNRIQYVEDLAPLAQLRLVSLDLYECPVTRIEDYRSRVFGLIKSLKYLDKMDAEENERPESDEEDEDDDDEDDDPGSGEVDGDERPFAMSNGHREGGEGILDVDEDEESDADEETEAGSSRMNGSCHPADRFRIGAAVGNGEIGDEDEEDGEDEDDDENDSGEEVDDDDDDDDVVEVHEIDDSDDEGDGIEEDDDDDDEVEEEEVYNEEAQFLQPQNQGGLNSWMEGEIDGHEQGDDEDEDDDGETGEEEQVVEEDVEFEDDEDGEDEEDDHVGGYLVQPIGQVVQDDAGASDMDPGNEDDEHDEEEEEEEEVDDDEEVQEHPPPPPPSSHHKRKRDDDSGDDDEED